MKAFFVRHGETNYNVLGLCNDDPTQDVHLTKKGKKQAEEIAAKLKSIQFDRVFASELPRTQETAKTISKDTSITVDPRINDRKTGFEGKPCTDFDQAMEKDPLNTRIGGGESLKEEKKRVIAFLEELKSKSYETVLVVSHSETMKIIKGHIKNLNDEEMWQLSIANGEILEVDL